jgi:hypothetical protein
LVSAYESTPDQYQEESAVFMNFNDDKNVRSMQIVAKWLQM